MARQVKQVELPEQPDVELPEVTGEIEVEIEPDEQPDPVTEPDEMPELEEPEGPSVEERMGMRGHDEAGNVRPADGRWELHKPADESDVCAPQAG